MLYIPNELVLQAKEMDLLTYLRSYEPEQLVQVSGDTYCTREHDSLKISNGKWHWFSRGIGGKSALDYLIKVRDYSFLDAVSMILGQAAARPPVFHAPASEERRQFHLPERNENNRAVVQYLLRRGIDRKIIEDCISAGLLYESKEYHNAVFVRYDSSGAPRYAALRGTRGSFKGEAKGCDKSYSFLLADDPKAESVHLFESAIDALSYATLLKKAGRDWRQFPLLSLAGVYKTVREFVVPKALERFLQEHPNIHTLLLHLDNDEIGRSAAQGIVAGLGDKFKVVDSPPTYGKDVNDYLIQRLSQNKRKEEHER